MNPSKFLRILAATIIVITTTTSLVRATPISVSNPSFETPVLASGSAGVPAGWNMASGATGDAGHYRSSSNPVFPNQFGDQLGFLLTRNVNGSFGALYQDVTTVASGTYKLRVAVATEPNVEPAAAPFKVNFEAVGGGPTTLLASNEFPLSMFNSSAMIDVVATASVPFGSSDIGRSLRIVLVVDTPDGGVNPLDPRGTYNVDHVRLELVPEPTMPFLFYCAMAGLLMNRESRGRRKGR